MAAITFDTLRINNNLKARGFTEEQAAVLTETVQEAIKFAVDTHEPQDLDGFATKGDIVEVKNNIKESSAELRTEIKEVRYEILKWMIPLILGLYGLIVFKNF